jgi:hypothetical protein
MVLHRLLAETNQMLLWLQALLRSLRLHQQQNQCDTLPLLVVPLLLLRPKPQLKQRQQGTPNPNPYLTPNPNP